MDARPTHYLPNVKIENVVNLSVFLTLNTLFAWCAIELFIHSSSCGTENHILSWNHVFFWMECQTPFEINKTHSEIATETNLSWKSIGLCNYHKRIIVSLSIWSLFVSAIFGEWGFTLNANFHWKMMACRVFYQKPPKESNAEWERACAINIIKCTIRILFSVCNVMNFTFSKWRRFTFWPSHKNQLNE